MLAALLAVLLGVAAANYPVFDYSTRMRILLVPADTKVGSVIYRLRGTDSDFHYPLQFDVLGEVGTSVVKIESLPCSKRNEYCEANVFLKKKLELGRVYDFKLRVRDMQGDSTIVESTLKATNGTTSMDTIFPHYTNLIVVPENTPVGRELDYFVVRKNPRNNRHVHMELWGSPYFKLKQKLASTELVNGTLELIRKLDFEQQLTHRLRIFATDAYADSETDTRNIAGFECVVVVGDIQDTPPVFILAPPITHLRPDLAPGDFIVQVQAEDGDKGKPRSIRYGLVSEGNPFMPFFNIDERSGNITLARPLKELISITHSHQPIMLTVMAEEMKTSIGDAEAMSATVELALLLDELSDNPPHFENENYVARIKEESPQGTALDFRDPWIPRVKDDDLGQNGIFSLSLEKDNGTFEISPSVVEQSAAFVIRVKNNKMLDYEKYKEVQFEIVAREVASRGLSSRALVTVYIDDVNDNSPVFLEKQYTVSLPENVTAGTRVVEVKAEDVDTGLFGKIRYTNILGALNSSLNMDSITGIITVGTNNHGFDRELAPEHRFNVEARDEEGIGNSAYVPLIIKLKDVNDNPPRFKKPLYEALLTPDLRRLSSRLIVEAVDDDAEYPNNEIRYEIMSGNYERKFQIDENTGEITLRSPLSRRRPISKREARSDDADDAIISMKIRAYDLGIPLMSAVVPVQIYLEEPKARQMVFILPKSVKEAKQNIKAVEEMLSTIAGGQVKVKEVRPYTGTETGTDLTTSDSLANKSVIVATVQFQENTVVDVTKIRERLQDNQTAVERQNIVQEYKDENRALFWVLVILAIIIALIILVLLLCCICQGCPLYIGTKNNRVNSEENVHLVVREEGNADDQRSNNRSTRKEAWSAEEGRRYWQFNRRNIHPSRRGSAVTLHRAGSRIDDRDRPGAEVAGNLSDRGPSIAAAEERRSLGNPHQREGPSVIYTKDLQQRSGAHSLSQSHRDVFLEDIDGDYPSARILGPREGAARDTRSLPGYIGRGSDEQPRKVFVIRDKNIRGPTRFLLEEPEDLDTDSMRRHEMERGSDVGGRREYRVLVKDGNRPSTEKMFYAVDAVDRALHRQRQARHRGDQADDVEVLTLDEESGREQHYIREGNAEILRLVTRGRPEEEAGDEQDLQETTVQPPPILKLQRPTAVAPGSSSAPEVIVGDDGKEIIMRRFMEDQEQNYRGGELADPTLQQLQLHQQAQLAEAQQELAHAHKEHVIAGGVAAGGEFINAAINYIKGQEQEEEDKESEKPLLALSMGTQTDCNTGTQTEAASAMKSRRRTRSENDSFSDDDYSDGSDRGRRRRRKEKSGPRTRSLHRDHGRTSQSKSASKVRTAVSAPPTPLVAKHQDKTTLVLGKRHKIKTPILEETESAIEAVETPRGLSRHGRLDISRPMDIYEEADVEGSCPEDLGYVDNKSSLLRRKKSKAKLAELEGNETAEIDLRQGSKDEDESPSTDQLGNDDGVSAVADGLFFSSTGSQTSSRRNSISLEPGKGSRRNSVSFEIKSGNNSEVLSGGSRRNSVCIEKAVIDENGILHRRKSVSVENVAKSLPSVKKTKKTKKGESRSVPGTRDSHRKCKDDKKSKSDPVSRSSRRNSISTYEKLPGIKRTSKHTKTSSHTSSKVDGETKHERRTRRNSLAVGEVDHKATGLKTILKRTDHGSQSDDELAAGTMRRSDSSATDQKLGSKSGSLGQLSDGKQGSVSHTSAAGSRRGSLSQMSAAGSRRGSVSQMSAVGSRRGSVATLYVPPDASPRYMDWYKNQEDESGGGKVAPNEDEPENTAKRSSVNGDTKGDSVSKEVQNSSTSVDVQDTDSKYSSTHADVKDTSIGSDAKTIVCGSDSRSGSVSVEGRPDPFRRGSISSGRSRIILPPIKPKSGQDEGAEHRKRSNSVASSDKKNSDLRTEINNRTTTEVDHLSRAGVSGVVGTRVFDDDLDSGIAMSQVAAGGKKRKNQLLEKKSIFTIAYDDMQTKQLRSDSTTPPY